MSETTNIYSCDKFRHAYISSLFLGPGHIIAIFVGEIQRIIAMLSEQICSRVFASAENVIWIDLQFSTNEYWRIATINKYNFGWDAAI